MDKFIDPFRQIVAADPDRAAICDGLRRLTYGDLDAASDAIAHLLVANGVLAGEVVGYIGDPGINRVAAYSGILKVGAGFLMLETRSPTAVHRELTEQADAVAVVYDPELAKEDVAEIGLPTFALLQPLAARS